MSDPRILLIGPALDLAESALSLERLRQVARPDVTKLVVTTGKFDAAKEALTFNVEGEYPAEPAKLQTLARWAEAGHVDPRFRDGYDLFCLTRILAKHKDYDFAVLLRDATNFDVRWDELMPAVEGKAVLEFSADATPKTRSDAPSNLLFHLKSEDVPALLEFAWHLYDTGVVYAMTQYSFKRVLELASSGFQFQEAIRSKPAPGGVSFRDSKDADATLLSI